MLDDTGTGQPGEAGEGRPRLELYFQAMIKAGASDLHLKAGHPPHVRVKTEVLPSRGAPLTAEAIREMMFELMTERQQQQFLERGNADLAYEIPGSDRFRINAFRQRGKPAIAVRRVTRQIPEIADLHLPPAVASIAEHQQGLILLAGPTGSGKSTTIAAMIQHINRTRPCHIVTVEDPIEYIYEDDKALINQRELGIDVVSFADALRALMREDPDVVLIGEMRDRETFQAALQASETGHLVFGTVHASSASQTIGRILDLFPTDARDLIRQSLVFNLRAVLCQKLLSSIAPGVDRVPAVEIMIANPSVRQMVAEARDAELLDVIQSHERDGMQSFTKSLFDLIHGELVEPKVAYEAAPNVDELKMLLKGISASRAGRMSR